MDLKIKEEQLALTRGAMNPLPPEENSLLKLTDYCHSLSLFLSRPSLEPPRIISHF